MEAPKGKWSEVLPGVLWAYRTTSKISTRETLFFFRLFMASKALIPMEIGERSLIYKHVSEQSNDEALHIDLDFMEERRELALIRMVAHKQRIERYYNRKNNQ